MPAFSTGMGKALLAELDAVSRDALAELHALLGLLVVPGVLWLNADGTARRYALPAAHVEALTDAESLGFLPPLAQTLVGAVRPGRYVLDGEIVVEVLFNGVQRSTRLPSGARRSSTWVSAAATAAGGA